MPVGQQRLQRLLDELGARRRVEQRLGARPDRRVRVVHQLADPLGGAHPSRLAQERGLHAALRERVGERRGEG